jgi:LPS O-antigen subunit length determinant protein (WzzB/FepE family)
MVAAVNTEIPFYLRGYTAIEKEIDLIDNRSDVTAFKGGLRALEQQQREITQDRTLERAAELWRLTPVARQDGFAAASMRIGDTHFKVKQSRMLVLALAGVLGAFFGVILVVFSNAVRKQKDKVVNA